MIRTREEMEKKIAELRASPYAIEVPGGIITPEILAKLPPHIRAQVEGGLDLTRQPVGAIPEQALANLPANVRDQICAAKASQKEA